MRLFYAVEFDQKTKDILVAKQDILKPNAVKANFTIKENLHLTLRFMGEVADPEFPVLQRIQDLVSKRHDPFMLEISGAGVFERGNKYIVWAGVKKNENLISLQRDLENEIAAHGFSPENRPYRPHITLAREFLPNGDIKKIMDEVRLLQHKFSVKSISLMESTRIDGKLVYLCRCKSDICADSAG